MNKLAKETTTKNRWTTKASDRKPHPESSVIEYSSKERNQRTDSNKTEGKNETPKQTALPEWLASDGLASLGEIDKLLSRDSSVLNKGVYKLVEAANCRSWASCGTSSIGGRMKRP
jgi:hypothetical protein